MKNYNFTIRFVDRRIKMKILAENFTKAISSVEKVIKNEVYILEKFSVGAANG